MFDILLQIGASKLLVSAVLAGVAWVVQRRAGHPAFTHRLWLLVLVALLLPAVASIPVLPGEGRATVLRTEHVTLERDAMTLVPAVTTNDGRAELGALFPDGLTKNGKVALVVVWLAVSALLLGWTLVRTLRFRRWLLQTSLPAPQELRDDATSIGQELGLAHIPELRATTARVSPMVYWDGGRVQLVIPSCLWASLDRQELKVVLAHELSHVRRRDHLVRWIEWLACSAFWWNPVAWWARRELRAAEEISCDALGAKALNCSTRAYALSLLRVVDFLSRPPTSSAPAFASSAVSSRHPKALERRFRVLISGKSTVHPSRWTRSVGTAAAVCLLPLGLVYCGFADQTTPTDLEEAPEPAVRAQSDLPSGEWQLRLVDRRGTDVVYWAMRWNDGDTPQLLLDESALPEECAIEPDQNTTLARSFSTTFCANALANQLRNREGVAAACVTAQETSGRWTGNCEFWVPQASAVLPELTTGEVFRSMKMVISGPRRRRLAPDQSIREPNVNKVG